ncbi:MAG: hypothetical protein EOM03_11630, partial [Clostridia bacterium]|nr:hypothetical protein [Clostridia bacterium]
MSDENIKKIKVGVESYFSADLPTDSGEEKKDFEEKGEQADESSGIREYPLLPLRGVVLIPYLNLTFDVSRELSKEAIGLALDEDMLLFVTTQVDSEIEWPEYENLYTTGCVAKIRQVVEINETGILRVTLEGLQRAEIIETDFAGHKSQIKVRKLPEDLPQEQKQQFMLEAKRRGVVEAYQAFVVETGRQSGDAVNTLAEEGNPAILSDKVASQTLAMLKDRQRYLELEDV